MYSDANVRAPYVWWSGAISNPNYGSTGGPHQLAAHLPYAPYTSPMRRCFGATIFLSIVLT